MTVLFGERAHLSSVLTNGESFVHAECGAGPRQRTFRGLVDVLSSQGERLWWGLLDAGERVVLRASSAASGVFVQLLDSSFRPVGGCHSLDPDGDASWSIRAAGVHFLRFVGAAHASVAIEIDVWAE